MSLFIKSHEGHAYGSNSVDTVVAFAPREHSQYHARVMQALPVLQAPTDWPQDNVTPRADAPINLLFHGQVDHDGSRSSPQTPVAANASAFLGPLPARAPGTPPPWLPLSPPSRPPPPPQPSRIPAPLRAAVIAVPAAALLIMAAATVIAWRWLNDYDHPWLPVCWWRRRRPRKARGHRNRRQTSPTYQYTDHDHASGLCRGGSDKPLAQVLHQLTSSLS